MDLSISNIAWNKEDENVIYDLIMKNGFSGLEIAPTQIFPDAPYSHIREAEIWALELKKKYNLVISSMQSIWFGRQENIFGTEEERQSLIRYTKHAIDFAEAIGCGNLVFGCPRNRNVPPNADPRIAICFFKELGEYAENHNTVIGMEANPPIYNTNYINDTASALRLIEEVDSAGFKLNLDIGTMLYNNENLDVLRGKGKLINHVHISEPYLAKIQVRGFHKELKRLLIDENYQKYISIEMSKGESIDQIQNVLKYIRGVFSSGK